jgi:hypothetical protein
MIRTLLPNFPPGASLLSVADLGFVTDLPSVADLLPVASKFFCYRINSPYITDSKNQE